MKKAQAKKLFRPLDCAIIAFVLFLAVFFFLLPFFSKTEDAYAAKITYPEGETVVLPLDTDAAWTVQTKGYTVTVGVEDGAAYIVDSTCKDGQCRHMGKISRVGQEILCAPAGLSVQIVSHAGGLYDAMAK